MKCSRPAFFNSSTASSGYPATTTSGQAGECFYSNWCSFPVYLVAELQRTTMSKSPEEAKCYSFFHIFERALVHNFVSGTGKEVRGKSGSGGHPCWISVFKQAGPWVFWRFLLYPNGVFQREKRAGMFGEVGGSSLQDPIRAFQGL